MTAVMAEGLRRLGYGVNSAYFNALVVSGVDSARVHANAEAREINLRKIDQGRVGLTLDETTTTEDLEELLAIFGEPRGKKTAVAEFMAAASQTGIPKELQRQS